MLSKYKAYHPKYGVRNVVGLYWFKDYIQISLENGVSSPIRTDTRVAKLIKPTGEKSHDGTEIYDGHILTDEGNDWQDSWIYGLVYYDEDERDWFVDWRSEGRVSYLASEPYKTIAGNVYEHPDLIEVK